MLESTVDCWELSVLNISLCYIINTPIDIQRSKCSVAKRALDPYIHEGKGSQEFYGKEGRGFVSSGSDSPW